MRESGDQRGSSGSASGKTLFAGRFEEVPVEQLLRSVSSAVIHVQCRGQTGRIVMSGGQLIHAKLDRASGPEALFRMTGVAGSYRVELATDATPGPQTIDEPLSTLLQEADRRARQRFAALEQLPPPDVPLVAGSGDVDGLSRVELELLARCDGERTRDEILLWWRDELAAVAAMARLWAAGGIDVVAREIPPQAPQPEAEQSQAFLPTLEEVQRRHRSRQLPIAAGLVFLGATAGVLGWFVQANPEPPGTLVAEEERVEASAVTTLPDSVDPPALNCPPGMVPVRGETFTMGTDSEDPVLSSSRPAHRVSVDPFCIDRLEVTVAQYRECVDSGSCGPASTASYWPQGEEHSRDWERAKRVYGQLCNSEAKDRDQHPVNCVTWSQSEAYCESQGKSLPSGAQWEAAARGPGGRLYPWGDEDPTITTGNFCGHECRRWREQRGLTGGETMHPERDGFAGTAPVGSFPEAPAPTEPWTWPGTCSSGQKNRCAAKTEPRRT